ncbi:LacI family DNA-binding transcriptional regulator [Cryptosporangium arvum]|uniref:LacI family DNA-binding transcriptional regulator n=1 Tax=Cryptosporangium arvum TaxID=80871 RepID=UPI0004B756BD|nr:LacI family DNA-binding transcriptional regulator [Cryptosporangium arvum]
MTVTDVARAAGVSTATVTRTIQGSALVTPATRERVLEVAQRLGYSPNPTAQDLRRDQRTAAIGLVTAGFTNMFQAGVAAGAERELNRTGLHLVIGSTDDDVRREPELARTMVDRRVRALIMMPDGDERDFLRPDRTFATPVVLAGRPANGLDVDVVMTDDDRGVQDATARLVALGHRRIAALAGRAGSFRADQRLRGFRAGLAAHRVEEDPSLVVTGLTTTDEARAAACLLLDRADPPTAILALNLGISTGALLDRIANRRSNAFITLDETELSAGLGITAITRDPQEVGRQAALLAVARIADPDAPPRTIVLPSTVVERGSGEVGHPASAR